MCVTNVVGTYFSFLENCFSGGYFSFLTPNWSLFEKCNYLKSISFKKETVVLG